MSRLRYVVVSTAITLALTQVIASPNNTIRASETCADLRQWARPFADRPLTLAELLAYRSDQQRAILGTVTPRVRSELWREHLDKVARRPEFTPQQRATIGALADALTPDAHVKDSPAGRRAQELWKQHESTFDREQQRAFYRLTGGGPLGQFSWCDCATSSGPWECYPLLCGGTQGCTPRPGCGFAGLDDCDAKCQ